MYELACTSAASVSIVPWPAALVYETELDEGVIR
jgi:hypothetical protein